LVIFFYILGFNNGDSFIWEGGLNAYSLLNTPMFEGPV